MKIKEIGYKTDIGRIREHNEDCHFVDEEIGLFIVADGMGGHQAGEIASEMAVDIISSSIKESLKGSSDISSIIHKAIQRANEGIYRRAKEDINLNGMGTTIVLALCREDKIYIAHVGDSRAYLIRGNTIKQLTEDHSIVGGMVKAGEITKEEAHLHHLRHVLTKALGSKESVELDIMSMFSQNGDYLLLCTDGLTDMMTDKEIGDTILNNSDPQKICEYLICAANEKGGRDNITVLLVSTNPMHHK